MLFIKVPKDGSTIVNGPQNQGGLGQFQELGIGLTHEIAIFIGNDDD